MNITFKSLLIYSEKNKKYFYSTFSEGINIIKGKNTSGKSSLIQSIIYSFGINDNNIKLSEILHYDVLFRLDIIIQHDGNERKVCFVRDGGAFFIVENDKVLMRFDGINGDNSVEHIKLKKALSNMFHFNMVLESKEELKAAPIEAILLPYYISQSVGWVYLRESFSGLNFYRNFKFDYLDYYLGITTDVDRVELQRLTKEKIRVAQEIEFYKQMVSSNESLELSQLLDETFKSEATEYLQRYASLRESLIKEEKHHLDLCNKQSLAINRRSVLRRIKTNIAKQRPELDQCPVCIQTLPSSMEEIYSHNQNVNDTTYEIDSVKNKIEEFQSSINSSIKKITAYNTEIEKKYALLERYTKSQITFSSWLEYKSNLKLVKNVHEAIGVKSIELSDIEDELKAFHVDQDVAKLRRIKSSAFEKIFSRNITSMGIHKTNDLVYDDLYRLNSFPFQGVELLKSVMSYHFSLNELISETKNIHRFPFILDAVMKEDIDAESRKKIFKFINDSSPKDTQMLFSVSEASDYSTSNSESIMNIEYVNAKYFANKAKLIQIGDGTKERDLLQPYNGEHEEYIKSTLDISYSN